MRNWEKAFIWGVTLFVAILITLIFRSFPWLVIIQFILTPIAYFWKNIIGFFKDSSPRGDYMGKSKEYLDNFLKEEARLDGVMRWKNIKGKLGWYGSEKNGEIMAGFVGQNSHDMTWMVAVIGTRPWRMDYFEPRITGQKPDPWDKAYGDSVKPLPSRYVGDPVKYPEIWKKDKRHRGKYKGDEEQ